MAGSSWARSLFFITRCHQICSAIKIFTLIRSEQPSWARLMLPALWPHSRDGRPPLDSHCSQHPRPVFFLNLYRAKVDPHSPGPGTAGIHIIKLFRPSVYTIGPSHSLKTVTHTELIKCQAMWCDQTQRQLYLGQVLSILIILYRHYWLLLTTQNLVRGQRWDENVTHHNFVPKNAVCLIIWKRFIRFLFEY